MIFDDLIVFHNNVFLKTPHKQRHAAVSNFLTTHPQFSLDHLPALIFIARQREKLEAVQTFPVLWYTVGAGVLACIVFWLSKFQLGDQYGSVKLQAGYLVLMALVCWVIAYYYRRIEQIKKVKYSLVATLIAFYLDENRSQPGISQPIS